MTKIFLSFRELVLAVVQGKLDHQELISGAYYLDVSREYALGGWITDFSSLTRITDADDDKKARIVNGIATILRTSEVRELVEWSHDGERTYEVLNVMLTTKGLGRLEHVQDGQRVEFSLAMAKVLAHLGGRKLEVFELPLAV